MRFETMGRRTCPAEYPTGPMVDLALEGRGHEIGVIRREAPPDSNQGVDRGWRGSRSRRKAPRSPDPY